LMVQRYQAVWEKLEISHDDFIRTTEERHLRAGSGRLARNCGKRTRFTHRNMRAGTASRKSDSGLRRIWWRGIVQPAAAKSAACRKKLFLPHGQVPAVVGRLYQGSSPLYPARIAAQMRSSDFWRSRWAISAFPAPRNASPGASPFPSMTNSSPTFGSMPY